MPVYIDRDTFSKWNGEVIGQQADLIKEDIAAAPPLPPVDSPSPAPAQPTFDAPTPSDTLTQPVPRATPGPPALGDLLAAAGLAESPSPPAGGAATGAQPGAAPAPSGGIPSLDSLLQSAGLADAGGAVGGAVQTVASAAPPPLQDLMRSAGLLDQPKPAQAQPSQAALVPTAVPQDIMAKAQPFLGSGYVWGGKDPNTGFDCSGLAGYLAGTGQPESTTTLYGKSAGIDSKDLKPGDLVFYNMGQSDMHLQHVGTYIGDGKLVQAGGSRNTVNIADINQQIGSAPEFRRLNAGTTKPTEGVPAQVASAPASATQTTAGLSGGGALSGQIGERGQQIMSGAAQAASWLGDQGQKALQAVLMTEGGLNNARGDNGQSVGPLQFYTGGQLANLAQQLGMGLEQAKQWVEQNPGAAVQWAIGTPDKPGYLGAAIQKGLQAGLQGADLATYAQRHGQVSVSPERAGANFQAMFGGGQGVIQGAAGAVQGAGQAAQSTFADLAQSGGNLASQGAALAQGLTQPAGESPTAAVEREANQRMAALQATLNTTLQGGQQAQDQRSVQASTLGGGLAGRSAVNVTDAGGGLTPEQIAGDATLPVLSENQSLNAQIRGPLGPAPLIQQPPSSGAADATLDAPAGAQSLGAASQMFPTWSQDARSAVLTSDTPRGPAQGTPVPPADYTTASMARPAEPPKPLWAQIGDTIGNAISQGLQPLMQAIQGTPAPASEGGGYGAVPPGGVNPLDQVGQGLSSAASDALSQVNLTDPTRSVIGGNPVAPATMPTSTELIQHAEEQKNQFIAENNPLRDVPVVGGLTTGVAQAVDPLMYAAGPILGTAAKALPTGAGLAGTLARGAVQGAGYGAIQGATQPEADVESTLRGAAIGAGLGAAGEGGIAALEKFNSPQVARAATGPPQTTSPELQKIRQMYEQGGTQPPTATATERLDAARDWVTRTFFNRNVDLDRMQERYAQALGRPLNADEMVSELSRLAPSPAAEVAVHESLGPAIRSVGDDYGSLRDFVTARSNVQVADGLGNDARLFSGGVTKAESQKAITDLEAEIGPQRFQQVQQAADQVSQFGRDLRQRLVDSGVLSQEQADAMEAKYPDWVKTRILDYMDPEGGKGGMPSGSKIGLGARDVHAYTEAGTTRAREDPLASMVAYAYQAEKMARKNDTFNALLKVDQASPTPLLRKVAQDYSPTANQVTVTGFVNGEKVKYVTDNKFLGEAINGTSVSTVPNWVSAWGQVFRAVATSRNPLFLAGNAALDVPTYVFRTAVREGGPENLPRILGTLAGSYVDAFRGVLSGTFHGATADFLKAGGGQSNVWAQTAEDAQQAIQAMRQPNVFAVNDLGDLKRLVTDLVTLKPVETLGERVELGPRVAAYRLAQQRGANPVQATIEGRTVTVDFSQGGTATKFLNQMIPFFNVGFQGPATIARSFRENPAGFVKTAGILLGLPAISAEVWNRADPQRAQDYADVPDYVKNQGIVVMLPGEAPVDPQGNRKPIYAVLKLREWAPFAALARNAASRVLGDDSRSWGDMTKDVLSGLSPTQATSVGQLGVEPLGGIPVLPAAAQLQFNQDFFRGRTIISQRADENASAAAKQLTPVIQGFLDAAGFQGDVHPSAVDFLIRNQLAGVGTAGLAASNIVAGQPPTTAGPETTPVVGGLAGRFVGTQTGQQLDTARGEPLTPEAHRILRDNGITATPSPASGQINNVPLLQAEEARYQQSINQRVDAAIKETAASAQFQGLSQEAKQRVMRQAMDDARMQAGNDVMAGVPRQEQKDRLQRQADQQIKMATTDQQRQAAQGALNEGMAGLMWDEVPHFAGVRGTPDQIAQQNAQIQAARSKLAQYRTGLVAQGVRSDQATERAAALLRRDDPAAYRLSQRDTVDQEVLARQRRRIDQQTGGALSRNAEKAAEFQVLTRGGAGAPASAGLTTIAPVLPASPSSVFAPRAPSALVGAGAGGLPSTPPVAP